jgi:transposase
MKDIKKNVGGAPTKLSERTKAVILEAIEKGATYELAAASAGISYGTFNNWMKRGLAYELVIEDANPDAMIDDEENEFYDFYLAVKHSESVAALKWLGNIDIAANEGHWQAAAWKLERRYPQQYGKTVQEIQGKDGGPINIKNIDVTKLSDDELRRIIEDEGQG